MTLEVPIQDFARTVRRVLGRVDAYLAVEGDRCVVTAHHPSKPVLIRAESPKRESAKLREALGAQGLRVHTGLWSTGSEATAIASATAEAGAPERLYVAAVAYHSQGEKPGLWVDAFPDKPTTLEVGKAMYQDFRESGEIGAVELEDFMRLAKLNIVVMSIEEAERYAAAKTLIPEDS